MFRGTIASVKDSVSKIEVAQEKEKGKQRLALGQVTIIPLADIASVPLSHLPNDLRIHSLIDSSS